MRNPLKRQLSADPKLTLRERAASLKATAGRVLGAKPSSPAEPVARMAPHHESGASSPSEAPTPPLAVDLMIRAEARRLVSVADAEFDRLYEAQRQGLDDVQSDALADRLECQLRIRALMEAAGDTDPEYVDWRNPPVGFMAHPAIEPAAFLNVQDGLKLEAERLHGIALAEFERRCQAFQPTIPGRTEADWSAHLRRALRLDELAAAAAPERAEPAGDDRSEPGFVLYEDVAGVTHRRPVAHWIGFMAQRLRGVAHAEFNRAFNAACNGLTQDECRPIEEQLRRDLRLDALHDLTCRSREVFEASREYGVGARWRYGVGDAANLDTDLTALEAEFLAAEQAYRTADAARDAAYAQYAEPEMPVELRVWRNDWIYNSIPQTRSIPLADGRMRVLPYGLKEVELLRSRPCTYVVVGGVEGEPQPGGGRKKIDVQAQARVDAIVAAWDRWQAEIAAAKEAAGLPELVAASNATWDSRSDILDRIRMTPARTLVGLGVKAQVAFVIGGDTDPKAKGLESYDTDDADAFIFDVAGDVLALTRGGEA